MLLFFCSSVLSSFLSQKPKTHTKTIYIYISIDCFGGTGVLAHSFLDGTGVVGTVSFHGGLRTLPEMAEKINSPLLVLSGGDDDPHTAIDWLENELEAVNATWQITRYSGKCLRRQICVFALPTVFLFCFYVSLIFAIAPIYQLF